ncbi:MAG TPA: hypothetical protein VH599_03610 [Ktedonobacterales bacterium]|jgi:drug/metabolite transporter (DMT)-like permease
MRATGIIGTVLGLILAIIGVYLLISAGGVFSIIVLVVGVVLLVLGAFAYRGSAKARSMV